MKKIICGLMLLVFMIMPVSVFAAGAINIPTETLTIEKGSTKTFNIVITNAFGFGNMTSKNTDVATINVSEIETGTTSSGSEIEIPVTVTGVSVGTTTIEVKITDMTTFDRESLNGTYSVNVKVVEKSDTTKYTVTYDANGGKGAPNSQTKEALVELTLSSIKPTYEGYEFIGWNIQKDGKGTSYSAGDKYTEDANLTLYAQWKQTSNVTKNPQTGDTLIYVVLLLTLGALIYSYWYMKKTQEN